MYFLFLLLGDAASGCIPLDTITSGVWAGSSSVAVACEDDLTQTCNEGSCCPRGETILLLPGDAGRAGLKFP